ncbi:MAG: YheT family hydrolase, partial [Bacteroidota bacterium]
MNTKQPAFNPSKYRRPYFFFSRHLETIIPSLFRRVELSRPESGALELSDGDFVEYDHYQQHHRKLVVLCHGLEGNSRKGYMLGMAKALLSSGHDVVAWNYRCCGNRLNRTERLYHSGATGDLEAIINHFAPSYSQTRLVGFSLGGNLILKYLGEQPERSALISGAVTFSVPADLKNASVKLTRTSNLIYSRYFLSG